jgi:predicted dehydrogenase
LPEARVVGLCDVHQAHRASAQGLLQSLTGERGKEFEDMRYAFLDPEIDAVSIAAPNHWHALASIWAMKSGKDVYCEKPASYNIYEGQRMLQTARETGRMLQIGSQHRSTPYKIRAIEALQGGVIGAIYQSRGVCYKRRESIGTKPDSSTPTGLNWDIFLGPAPYRPYNELRYDYNWHWFWDTGNGDLGNQGVHQMSIARWALGDPLWPKSVDAHGGKYVYDDDQETPNMLAAHFDFGGRELVFEVRGLFTGTDGVPSPPGWTPRSRIPRRPSVGADRFQVRSLDVRIGNFFFGAEGWAAMNDEGFQAYKGDSNEIALEESNEPELGDPTALHMRNFLAACRSRDHEDLNDEIETGYPSAALCHMANISYRVGRRLTVQDGPTFANDNEANDLLTRDQYRSPYVV